jgi:cytochrome c-type biogenesis protein CcmH/NrfG
MTRRTTVIFAAVLALGLMSGCSKLKSRDSLNKGVQAYKNARYQEAVDYFKTAIQLDPENPNAKLYLATAYMIQYIPGADSPENNKMAQAAYDQFQEVLKQDPNNSVAMASIALLYFNQKKMDDAQQWYSKLAQVDPNNKEAFYTLGVIAWTQAYQDRMEARAKMGMKPEDPGPLKDKKVRDALREKNGAIIEDGIQKLTRAIEIDPQYDDAMAYLNLLHRERADLADTSDAYKKDVEVADAWVQKTLDAKKAKAAAAAEAAGTGIIQE